MQNSHYKLIRLSARIGIWAVCLLAVSRALLIVVDVLSFGFSARLGRGFSLTSEELDQSRCRYTVPVRDTSAGDASPFQVDKFTAIGMGRDWLAVQIGLREVHLV